MTHIYGPDLTFEPLTDRESLWTLKLFYYAASHQFSLMYAHELVALISPNSANWSKTHKKVVHVLNACIDILSQSQLHFSLHPIILNIVTLCCRRATPDEIKPIREREDDFFDNFQKSINFRRFFRFF